MGTVMEPKMKCGKCGSENIYTQKNVGWDIDETGEERQHIDRCQDCGAWRLHIDVYAFNPDDSGKFFGEWYEQKNHNLIDT